MFLYIAEKGYSVVINLLKDDGELLCLIKPQFEAGREKVGKHGVVRDKKVHEEVVKDIITFSLKEGLKFEGLIFHLLRARKATSNTLFICQKRGQYKRRRTF